MDYVLVIFVSFNLIDNGQEAPGIFFLFSIQLLWKPKILNVEDIKTNFEWSKEASVNFVNYANNFWHKRN